MNHKPLTNPAVAGYFMATQKKIDIVNELTDKLSKAKSVVLADYRGLKHKQLEELRKSLKKVEGEFVITKNRLLGRALGEKAQNLEAILKDSTATLFSFKDEVAALKEMLKFFKNVGAGRAKGGFLGNISMTEQEVDRLAKLPAREVLLGQLAGQLNAPIQGLHYALSWNINKLAWALNSIKEKKLNNLQFSI